MEPESFEAVAAGKPQPYGRRVIQRFYAYQDRILREGLDSSDENLVYVLCSDHGFRAMAPGQFQYWVFQRYSVYSGTHEATGVGLVLGKPFRRGYRWEACSVLDLTPTLLALFRLPVGEDMDGVARREFLRTPEQWPSHRIPTWERGNGASGTVPASPADELIRDKLRGMQYIR
jgi:arylsulfatase A-like enzyme